MNFFETDFKFIFKKSKFRKIIQKIGKNHKHVPNIAKMLPYFFRKIRIFFKPKNKFETFENLQNFDFFQKLLGGEAKHSEKRPKSPIHQFNLNPGISTRFRVIRVLAKNPGLFQIVML